MRIEVTAADITDAARHRNKPFSREPCFNCPIAYALKRKTGLVWAVGYPSAIARGEGAVRLPEEALRFLVAWDKKERFSEPMEFEFAWNPKKS